MKKKQLLSTSDVVLSFTVALTIVTLRALFNWDTGAYYFACSYVGALLGCMGYNWLKRRRVQKKLLETVFEVLDGYVAEDVNAEITKQIYWDVFFAIKPILGEKGLEDALKVHMLDEGYRVEIVLQDHWSLGEMQVTLKRREEHCETTS